jgi:hypothetical protein
MLLDAWSFTGTASNYDKFVSTWLLKGYAAMGYQAVNLGVVETQIPVNTLREWDAISQGMLVSANLNDSTGLPVTRRSLIRTIGDFKVGITGITGAGMALQDATELPVLVPPVEPLKEVMAEFEQEKVDFVILLADTIHDETEAVLKEVPGIDLVIQSREFQLAASYSGESIGDTRIVKIGNQGKYLGWTRLDFEPDGTRTGEEDGLAKLDSSVPTSSDISTLLVGFRTELRQRRNEFLGDPGNPFQRASSAILVDILTGYAGPSHCQACHAGYDFDQQMVFHSDAWLKLQEEGRTNPECLKCHATGYGVPTGVEDPFRDSHLTGVTCEACHGPAADHVREKTAEQQGMDPSSMLPAENPTGLPFRRDVPESVCRSCHTEHWSPDFNYETWLPKVNHSSFHDRQRLFNPATGEPITGNETGDAVQGSAGE